MQRGRHVLHAFGTLKNGVILFDFDTISSALTVADVFFVLKFRNSSGKPLEYPANVFLWKDEFIFKGGGFDQNMPVPGSVEPGDTGTIYFRLYRPDVYGAFSKRSQLFPGLRIQINGYVEQQPWSLYVYYDPTDPALQKDAQRFRKDYAKYSNKGALCRVLHMVNTGDEPLKFTLKNGYGDPKRSGSLC